ncbi:DUF6475 domain-containing protein [Solidesulfovibrio sp.]|uniref:DUF6475 domain-containing protein n=1 Tax=Solidesulfovibrio sp. TaxID=2910990 RepID=UPI002627FC46|nr:DUF6475 domain-containing protein [Solidesulfovibrio sp.]
MQDRDFEPFVAIMLGLADNFGAELSANGLEMRFEAMKAFSLDQVRQASMAILATRKFQKMPTVAEFLEHLQGGSCDDKAEVEAGKVIRAIEQHGGYTSVAFDDPVTQAVIAQGFGGWAKMCEELSAAEEKWFRKDFAKMYAAYARQRVEVFGHLPGRFELMAAADNSRFGPPALVGDKAKAAAIASGGVSMLHREEPLSIGDGLARMMPSPEKVRQ